MMPQLVYTGKGGTGGGRPGKRDATGRPPCARITGRNTKRRAVCSGRHVVVRETEHKWCRLTILFDVVVTFRRNPQSRGLVEYLNLSINY